MSKYEPLAARLAGQAGPEWKATFKDLEKLLGFPLPKAASSGAWWKKGVWADAGWTAEADPAAGRVTFRTTAAATPEAAPEVPAVTDEPPILKRLDVGPGWGVALVLGGVAVVAGIGALALRGFQRKR